MGFGYRFGAAVAGMLILVNAAAISQVADPAIEAQQVPPATREPASSQPPALAAGLSSALAEIGAAIRSLKVEVDRRENEQKEQREKADLVAQEAMANWALGTLVVNCIGLLAIGGTLVFTGYAAAQTKRSADAALASVAVTRDLGHAQTRPYVSITGTSIEPVQGGAPRLRVKLTNHGLSPALRVHCRAFCFRPSAKGGSDNYKRELPPPRAKFVLFRDELRGTSFELDQPYWEHLVVSVSVTYVDTVGLTYRTKEVYRLIERGDSLAFETFGDYARAK